MQIATFLSMVETGRARAQGTVEYSLVVAGGALLALLGYTLFSPIIRDVAQQVQGMLT